MKTIQLVSLMLLIMVNGKAVAGDRKYMGPDDPAAVLAAEQSVAALGLLRGAVSIQSSATKITAKSLEIIGTSKSTGKAGLSLTADIRDADKILKDLGAQKSDMGYELSLSGDVLFDFDKWAIKPEAEGELIKLADALKKLGHKQVVIEGHTDSVGSDAYNIELSKKRAESVQAWLIHKGGVTMAEFSAQGFGESKPVAPNTFPDGRDAPEGRAKNRRVQIHIQ